ncbi:response regulator [Notoacmeibacter sp. MSK16QG-6]|uniref:response regulator n=1 Tax=Notoacmeibacter sp. MSK16QG-6 TaxID=2957982 RepID=UPI0035311036
MRILYVDDDSDITEIATMSLRLNSDLEVRSCANGEDALATARCWQPDLVLLDVMMPKMDGPTVLKALQHAPETADIPVVFMTARTQPFEIERFESLGARGVIAKPFDPMTLATQVMAYLKNAPAHSPTL